MDERKIEHHPDPYIIHAEGKHTHTLILLHGTSTSGPEFGDSILDFEFELARECVRGRVLNHASTENLKSIHKEGFFDEDDSPYPEVENESKNENENGGGRREKKTSLRKELSKGGVLEGVRVVFPTGSLKKTTVFGGRETNAWFDVHDFGDRTVGEKEQVEGLRESVGYLKELVMDEVKLLDAEEDRGGRWLDRWTGGRRRGKGGGKGRVVLGGFSQGSAMAVVGLLSGEFEGVGIGGVVGFSGWLPFRKQVDEAILGDQEPRKDLDVEIRSVEGIEKRKRRGLLRWIWTYFLRCAARISWFLPWMLRKHFLKATTAEHDPQAVQRRKSAVQYIRSLLSLPPRTLDIDPSLPILLGHGAADQKVKYEWALQMRHSLMDMGLNLKSRRYEGVEHWYCGEEMRDLVTFLKEIWNLR
ncbi:hypothetical protein EG329_001764 [Mollisiaceae sp. DMI_Dod_QoI]|nr:hypothetical protein EG329_001764 [Helotiales sp. DMI_Dod_QoI]